MTSNLIAYILGHRHIQNVKFLCVHVASNDVHRQRLRRTHNDGTNDGQSMNV